MNKKKLVLLAVLGLITDKEASALSIDNRDYFSGDDINHIAESLQVHPGTLRFLKMLSQMGALEFHRERVTIHPDHLPEDMIKKLHESAETHFEKETGMFTLRETFVNTLATNHTFSQIGTYTSVKANQDILKRLKEKTTPVLREDLILYSTQRFMPGDL